MEGGELSARPPYAQSGHVGHVPRFRCPGCTAVHNPSLGQLLLQLQHGEPSLAGLAGAGWNQVLGFVTLIKYYLVSELSGYVFT